MNNKFTIFEHQALYVHKGDQRLTPTELEKLQTFFKEQHFPYYSLVHKGVRFCEYVGVIRVGNLTIEVLPKADRQHDEVHWRNLLIDMLQNSGIFKIHAPSSANLKLKSNSILDFYFSMFVDELEKLLHAGLIKRYRKIAENTTVLMGKLLINSHISFNILHRERFYVEHSTYDQQHLLNQILYKTINLLKTINLDQSLASRINYILLNFPQMKDVKVNSEVFERIVYDRKSQSYRNAIDIARLLLLNYHPDINFGRENILALMFDMNLLWERFVLKALQKYNPLNLDIIGNTTRKFWKADVGRIRVMKPDIVLKSNEKNLYLLDTKWKNISGASASDDDLRQMYAYSKFHDNADVCILYPGEETSLVTGNFMSEQTNDKPIGNSCGIMKILLLGGRIPDQKELASRIFDFLFNN